MTRICFVRHGETDWNIELRMQGHVDIPLNATGSAQAEALGRHFSKGMQADALYSSDLLRARQTAQPISDVLGVPIIPLVELRERSFGCCEGLVIAEILERFPEEAMAMKRRDAEHVPQGGESRRQHHDRIRACVVKLVARHPSQTLVVVTHGGVLDVIYRMATGLPIVAPRNYPISNAGLNWVRIEGEEWAIESWGEVAHLGR